MMRSWTCCNGSNPLGSLSSAPALREDPGGCKSADHPKIARTAEGGACSNYLFGSGFASLGQLTAGIAHEIKNPLNFVNNFADLSVELLDELKETTAPAIAALDEDKRTEIDETIGMLTGNLEKIAEHGRRADGIVKSMLV